MERIILDVDTGEDDAIAIELARGLSDKIKVEALIATAGNVALCHTLPNTLNIRDAVKLDAPVYRGSERPLKRDVVDASSFHGENGLAGPVFPPRKEEKIEDAIDNAIKIIMSNPGEITFVSVGPYTDLATMMMREPKIKKALKRIVVMGGSLSGGNASDWAEFNIFGDPEAADIVFSSGVEVVMMALDITLRVILTEEIYERIKALRESAYKRLILSQLSFYIPANMKSHGTMPAMHDPCTILYLYDNSIFTFERKSIRVELEDEEKYGMTYESDGEKNVLFAKGVDLDKFWHYCFNSFEKLAEVMDENLYFC